MQSVSELAITGSSSDWNKHKFKPFGDLSTRTIQSVPWVGLDSTHGEDNDQRTVDQGPFLKIKQYQYQDPQARGFYL